MSCSPLHPRKERLFAFALPLLLISCHGEPTAPASPPRYAVLRFENLSGDPALDWTGRAISESLPAMLSGAMDGPVLASASLFRLAPALGARPTAAPGISSERDEALLAGANRIVAGYVERPAGLIRITANEEDTGTGKSLRIVSATGPSPMAALNRLALEFSQRARPAPTSNPEALRDFATAVESSGEPRLDLLDRAIHLDPDFGAPQVVLTGLYLAQGNRAAAEDAIARARARKIDPLSRADLDLAAAELTPDRSTRISALREVSDLSPGDTFLLRSLADNETAAGQFAAAAADWKKLTAESPADPGAWNSLGYARSYAGDYAGALDAFREYARLRPKEANPSDSIGDLNYSFGKFTEAAADYLEAHRKQPGFEQYGDLYKAAWAKFHGGDKKGADSLFAQFRTERLKTRGAEGVIELLTADWLYRTGRQSEAFAALRKLVSVPGATPVRSDAYAQLTIWDLLRGDRAKAVQDAAAIGTGPATPPVLMARFAAQPSASAAEWQMRSEREIPPSAGVLRVMALGYALVLDGKGDAALPVWRQIVDTTSATDFFSRAVYARLQGQKPAHPLLPDSATLNQFSAILR